MSNKYFEYNFDGLVGPTHNYAGLAVGNVASKMNYKTESNPKAAALQGLAKMKRLHDLGLKQAVLPPQPRPDLKFLKSLGFTGSNEQILTQALKQVPRLFSASYSASSMWTANAATVSPSLDTYDNRLHFTPANLAYNIHRSIEAETTYKIFTRIFNDQKYFAVHKYLMHSQELGDEGAANHTRFCTDYSSKGVGLFVYGREFYNNKAPKPKIFPARQTLEASKAVARQHGLDLDNIFFLQQNPDAIDAGVFHNDVCAVGNQNILLCHELAFIDQTNNLAKLKDRCTANNIDLNIIEISNSDLPLDDMVSSYLFNSQLVNIDNNKALIAPKECMENIRAHHVINNIINDSNNNINEVIYVDCRQSMRNGGGPACLRLRVLLSEQETQAITANVILSNQLFSELESWINKHYREHLSLDDLLDPLLVEESYTALDELTEILELGSIYNFQ